MPLGKFIPLLPSLSNLESNLNFNSNTSGNVASMQMQRDVWRAEHDQQLQRGVLALRFPWPCAAESGGQRRRLSRQATCGSITCRRCSSPRRATRRWPPIQMDPQPRVRSAFEYYGRYQEMYHRYLLNIVEALECRQDGARAQPLLDELR